MRYALITLNERQLKAMTKAQLLTHVSHGNITCKMRVTQRVADRINAGKPKPRTTPVLDPVTPDVAEYTNAEDEPLPI